MSDIIINKVVNSGLVSFNLEEYFPEGDRVVYDLKDNLFQGIILKEKDFRQFLKEHDWEQYQNKHIAITCSADAIIPTWAYMLLAVKLEGIANAFVFGSLEQLEILLFTRVLNKLDFSVFQDERVVIKGCSKIEIPTTIYVDLTERLKPFVKSLMFGEPCSTVPLFKKKSIR
tara:strand:+ start:541 stop:1056 length:516 start_codon:yes stop_codon:yes gene_type:complete